MNINLSKSELDNIRKGLEKINFKNESDLFDELNEVYESISYPPKNPMFKDWSKEQIFFLLIRSYDLLCFYYIESLQKNSPEILLNAFYTFNHINATFALDSGYDHCISLKPVLLCFAGNNLELINNYLPKEIGPASKGHRFLVTGINLILAIRGNLDKNDVLIETAKFLKNKNPKFENAIIKTLQSIMLKDHIGITNNLEEVTKLHKSSKWLHDFNNQIGKLLPFFSYALYSIAYHHLDKNIFEYILPPCTNIWWHPYQELNIKNSFTEGTDIVTFTGNLACINEIKSTLSKQTPDINKKR